MLPRFTLKCFCFVVKNSILALSFSKLVFLIFVFPDHSSCRQSHVETFVVYTWAHQLKSCYTNLQLVTSCRFVKLITAILDKIARDSIVHIDKFFDFLNTKSYSPLSKKLVLSHSIDVL